MKILKHIIYVLLLTSCNILSASHVMTDVDFPLVQDWSFTVEGSIRGLSVSDSWAVICETFKLTAVDIDSGAPLWMKELILDSDSLPLLSGDILAIENANRVSIIDRNGKDVASIELDRNSESAALVAFHSPYVFIKRLPSWFIEIYSIETKSMLWSIPIGRGGVDITLDAFNDTVYITTLNFISAYQIDTGKLVWEHKRSASTSTFDSGVLYFYEVAPESLNNISAFDVITETDLWRLELDTSTETEIYSMAVLGDSIILATNIGLIAINKYDGKKRWASVSNDNFITNPVTIDSIMYARGAYRTIYAISPDDGNEIGYLKLDDPPIVVIPNDEFGSALMVASDSIIFYYDKNVYLYK